jgi:hypothetical protein
MKAETKAFDLNTRRDGFTYWAETTDDEWRVFRRGKDVDKEPYDL